MGVLASLLFGPPRAAAPAADHDFWYRPAGAATQAGVDVSEDGALRISTVFRCVGILAGLVATLPLLMYRRRPDGGKDRATNHPLAAILHDQPNTWQTAFEFREQMQGHLLLRGNAYAEILPGPRGFADQLVPLHPDRVMPKKLDSGRIVYEHRQDNGMRRTLVQDEVFHLRGPSSDGVKGLSVIALARESMGLALATEGFGARLFSQRPTMAGILKHPHRLTSEASKRMAESFTAATTGLANAHLPAVLEEGTDWVSVGMTSEDSQFLETRRFQVADIARWFGVPLPMLNETEKTTSWGTGIEQFMLAFVIHTLMPWLKRWEQAIGRDLVLATETYFAEFLVDALLRGATKERYEAYSIALGGRAWMAPNEARTRENLNRVEGYDEIAREAQGAASSRSASPARSAAPRPEDAGEDEAARAASRARTILSAAAARLVRREILAIQKWAPRHAADAAAWRSWVEDFYANHADRVAEALAVDRHEAQRYTLDHQQALLRDGVAALEDWDHDAAPALVAMAMRGRTA